MPVKRKRDSFLSLSDEDKQKLIENYSRSIGKGLETGLMTDWTIVMKTAISCSGLDDAIKKRKKR